MAKFVEIDGRIKFKRSVRRKDRRSRNSDKQIQCSQGDWKRITVKNVINELFLLTY
jgi:hypothetical protein